MPIANCFFVSAKREPDAETIVAAWSERSGIDADEMTVNVVHADQGGKRYAVMAWLYLPSLWSDEARVALSEGLAAALASVSRPLVTPGHAAAVGGVASGRRRPRPG